MRVADLRRDLRALNEMGALNPKPIAKDGLAGPAAVGVRGVEAANADATGVVEQLKRLALAVADAAQMRGGTDSTETAAAEPDSVDVEGF